MQSCERPTKIRKVVGNESDDCSKCIKVANSITLIPDDPIVAGNLADEFGHGVAHESNKEQQSDLVRTEDLDFTEKEDPDLTGEEENGQSRPQNCVRMEPAKPLSKNQQKKLRRKAEWEAKAEERRLKRREERKRKRERRQERMKGQGEGPEANFEEEGHKARLRSQQFLVPLTFVIDCDFNDLMLEHELKSLASQITRCYSDNRNALYKAHIVVSSFGGALKERFEGPLRSQHKNWAGHIKFLEGDFVQVAEDAKLWMTGEGGGEVVGALADPNQCPRSKSLELKGVNEGGSEEQPGVEVGDKGNPVHNQARTEGTIENDTDRKEGTSAMEHGEIVYLSSESDEVLMELKPYSTYIIGGLVDHNRHKGICYKRARERGVRTARLPIGEYLKMASRQVLATNHVCEIMLNWLSCGDWASSFAAVIPKRKEWSIKDETDMREEKETMQEDEKSHTKVEESGW